MSTEIVYTVLKRMEGPDWVSREVTALRHHLSAGVFVHSSHPKVIILRGRHGAPQLTQALGPDIGGFSYEVIPAGDTRLPFKPSD